MRIAAFSGPIKDFKLYLLARRMWLEKEKSQPATTTGKAQNSLSHL